MDGANTTSERTSRTNIGAGERVVSAILGGALAFAGVRRRSAAGAGMAVGGSRLLYRGLSGHSYLYQVFGVNTASTEGKAGVPAAVPAEPRSMTIGASVDDVYRAWIDPRNLPRVMAFLAQVTPLGADRAHWIVRAPLGLTLEWDTRIVEDTPDRVVRWESLPGAPLPNAGSAHFTPTPGDRGTRVTLDIRFSAPGGALGAAVARRFGVIPDLIADKTLRRFRSLVEAGEIPVSTPQPAGRNGGWDQGA